MIYAIDHAALYAKIDEEVSRVAAAAYAEGGQPLYDAIVLHKADSPDIRRLIGDAVNTLVKRTSDIVTILANDAEGRPRLEFRVPDIDESTIPIITEEIDRFISLNVCAAWFQSKAKDKVEEFSVRGQAAMDKAAVLLKTRKAPQR